MCPSFAKDHGFGYISRDTHLFLVQKKVFRMINMLTIRILDPDPPRFSITVKFIVPFKLGPNGKAHAQYSSCNWLDTCCYGNRWKPLYTRLYCLTHTNMMDEVAWEEGKKRGYKARMMTVYFTLYCLTYIISSHVSQSRYCSILRLQFIH